MHEVGRRITSNPVGRVPDRDHHEDLGDACLAGGILHVR